MRLQFPRDRSVGEVLWWNPDLLGNGGHALAIGQVEVPDGVQLQLSVGEVVAVEALHPPKGWSLPVSQRDRSFISRPFLNGRGTRDTSEVVWQQGNQGNLAGAWPASYSVDTSDVPVDLEFLRGLPARSVTDLELPDSIVDASLPAITHLAPGLRHLDMTRTELDDASLASVARLDRLEELRLCGDRFTGQGLSQLAGLDQLRDLNLMVFELDDASLALVAGLARLESLQLYDGRFTGRGLSHLAGLTRLGRLHIEMNDLEPSWFAFAAGMPNLVALTGPDETPEAPWDAAKVNELRRMLPGVQVC